MADSQNQEIREIRITPNLPGESVLAATARGMRSKKTKNSAPRDTRKHVNARLSIPANVELGSGIYVNIVNPEEAAEKLRNGAID